MSWASSLKLEDQVCNLQLSKRLKELGVEQESLFVWTTAFMMDREHQRVFVEYMDIFLDRSIKGEQIICSAFTVAELGEMLPSQIGDYWLRTGKPGSGSQWSMWYEIGAQVVAVSTEQSEVDTRAKMLIYLIENKLLEKNK